MVYLLKIVISMAMLNNQRVAGSEHCFGLVSKTLFVKLLIHAHACIFHSARMYCANYCERTKWPTILYDLWCPIEDCWSFAMYTVYIYIYVDLFKGCRPCRRPRKKWQGSKAGRKTLRCVALWGSRPFCYVHPCEIYLIGLNFHV